MYKLLVPALMLLLPLQVVAGHYSRPLVAKPTFKTARVKPAPQVSRVEFVTESLPDEGLPAYQLTTLEVVTTGTSADWGNLPEIEPLSFI